MRVVQKMVNAYHGVAAFSRCAASRHIRTLPTIASTFARIARLQTHLHVAYAMAVAKATTLHVTGLEDFLTVLS